MSSNEGNLLVSQGRVVAVEDSFVLIKTQQQTGCSGCSSESGCGTAALSKLFTSTRRAPLKVLNTLQAKVGDQVELTLDESKLVKHSFMAYGMPLVGLFVFAILLKVLGQAFFGVAEEHADLLSISGGLLGLFAGWLVTRRFYKPTLPVLAKILK